MTVRHDFFGAIVPTTGQSPESYSAELAVSWNREADRMRNKGYQNIAMENQAMADEYELQSIGG